MKTWMKTIVKPWILCMLLTPLPISAAESAMPDRATYDQLQEWRFTTRGVALGEGGLEWSFDTASWRLESGEIQLQEPTPAGVVTGLVFEGSGHFRMAVPDPVELTQLRRFTRDPELDELEVRFERMVLRAVGRGPLADLALPAGATFETHPLARNRHEHWLVQRRDDVDAVVFAALANPGGEYLRADMETESGWLTYVFEHGSAEEIRVEKFQYDHSFLETWVSLDRPEERDSNGRPASHWQSPVDIIHVEITADLTEPSRRPQRGVSLSQPVDAKFRAALEFEPLAEGTRAFQLYLSSLAEVTAVRDGEGRELEFLRDAIGTRSRSLEKRIHDSSLVVLLAEPLGKTGTDRLEIDYEMEIANYAPGRRWYPAAANRGLGLGDEHTARLELTFRDEYSVRAMGRRLEERDEQKLRTEVWQIDQPVRMITFGLSKKYHEETFEFDGLPEITSFGSLDGYMNEDRIRNVGADVVNSLNFFQKLFGERLPVDHLYATTIPSGHGQAFDGFLHISEYSTQGESVAGAERFRAHEVAHQWWGHQVGWATYRDQWLSESFAEYSAMLFVEATVDKGPKLFQEMLDAYQDQTLGSLKTALSQFSRPGATVIRAGARERIGPIGHGYRCGIAESQGAYVSQVYVKGAVVLHMLRVLTRSITKNDETFFEILRDFIETHRGGRPTTADFEAIVAKHAPADWSWFFDQWVYGAEIPSYVWDYDLVAGENGGSVLRLSVEQSGVSEGFRMAVPVRMEFGENRSAEVLVMIGKPEQTIEIPLPERPKKVVFNPDRAILAEVKKR